MTEYEFLNLSAQAMESGGVVTATTFTLVFGYLAGLRFFLAQAPLFMKIAAFGFFSVCLIWMWAGMFGSIQLWVGIFDSAAVSISQGHTYLTLTDANLVFWVNFNDYTKIGLNVVFSLIWLSLLYTTFFLKWGHSEQSAD